MRGPHQRVLPRRLGRRVAWRTLGFAISLTVLVLLLQLGRAADLLADPALPLEATTILRVAAHAVPSVAALTLPMGLLVAVGLTLGETVAAGEATGWAMLGRSGLRLIGGIGVVAVAVSTCVSVLAASLGPHVLERGRDVLRTAMWRGLVASIHGEAGGRVELDDRTSVARFYDIDWTRAQPAETLRLQATTVEAALEPDAVRIDAAGVHLTRRASTDLVALSAEQMETTLPLPEAVRAESLTTFIPAVEARAVSDLWRDASDGDSLARGQLVKRTALAALPVAAAALLCALLLTIPALGRPDVGMLLGLLLGVSIHGVARGSEMIARASMVSGVLVVAIVWATTLVWGARRLARH